MLTTATTVLGLSPLLFETSQDAQFLKPTVITLVYGLGFGMFLVLLVVPAVMAMQQDLSRQLRALRRAMAMPARGRLVSGVTVLAGFGAAAVFAATLGSVILTGELWPVLAARLPDFDIGMAVAFGLFAAGLAGLVLAAFSDRGAGVCVASAGLGLFQIGHQNVARGLQIGFVDHFGDRVDIARADHDADRARARCGLLGGGAILPA